MMRAYAVACDTMRLDTDKCELMQLDAYMIMIMIYDI